MKYRHIEIFLCLALFLCAVLMLWHIVNVCCDDKAIKDTPTIEYVTLDTSCDCYWVLAWYTENPAICTISFCSDKLCFPEEYESEYQNVHIKILPEDAKHITIKATDMQGNTTKWETDLCTFVGNKPEVQVW